MVRFVEFTIRSEDRMENDDGKIWVNPNHIILIGGYDGETCIKMNDGGFYNVMGETSEILKKIGSE